MTDMGRHDWADTPEEADYLDNEDRRQAEEERDLHFDAQEHLTGTRNLHYSKQASEWMEAALNNVRNINANRNQ